MDGITVSLIGGKSTIDIETVGPFIPAELPTGDYYLGVILNVDDSDMTNNASGKKDIDIIFKSQ